MVVQVTFNEPIDPLSVNSSTFYLRHLSCDLVNSDPLRNRIRDCV